MRTFPAALLREVFSQEFKGFFFWLVRSDSYKRRTEMSISYFPSQPKIQVKQEEWVGGGGSVSRGSEL